jgi:alpha-tubulin suppressor-like RCC1 family protein
MLCLFVCLFVCFFVILYSPRDDGKVFAFGSNEHGQLGVGGLASAFSPVQIPFFAGRRCTKVVCGYDNSFVFAGM